MEWGMANRLAQLIQPDGHALFLPVDHGYFQGPTRKLEEPRKTIEPLLPYADALFITRGVLRASVDPDNSKPVILRVSGGTSMVGKDLANEGLPRRWKKLFASMLPPWAFRYSLAPIMRRNRC